MSSNKVIGICVVMAVVSLLVVMVSYRSDNAIPLFSKLDLLSRYHLHRAAASNPDFLVVGIHGVWLTDARITAGTGFIRPPWEPQILWSPGKIAKEINEHVSNDDNRPILLIMCGAGKGSPSTAETVARLTKRNVLSSPDFIVINSNGQYYSVKSKADHTMTNNFSWYR